MYPKYIRMVVDMGQSQDDGPFTVHAVKEEDQGPDVSFVAVLARVMERIGTPHKLRLIAGVITSLGHTSVSATMADPCITTAEEELIAAAHQLVNDWTKSDGDCVELDEKDEIEQPV
jgi:hypothetical protein